MVVKIFVVLVQLFLIADSVSLTYILKREKERLQPSCIAEDKERYAGVGWVYPLPSSEVEGLPNTTTKYIPSIQNDYNCKFSKNEKCNLMWAAKDWQIDETSSRTREFIDDSRWEDLPTLLISNSTLEFEHRTHLENAQKVGFSVRAVGSVEIFLCIGWNPKNYPCYYFHIDKQEIYFTKLERLTSELNFKNSQLQYSKTATNIVAEDEWRSFEISFNHTGNISLVDKNNADRLLISHIDNKPLTPSYLLMRSSEPSLWKVIENNFIYTETAQTTRMGPQFHSTYKDLCVSLLVATCSNCQMTFFYMNGTVKNELKYVGPTDEKWIEIKLKKENIRLTRFNLFVQTEFVNKENGGVKGWWAFDNVRVCNENEVKVTYLKLNQTFAEDDTSVSTISCQLIAKPSFRPQSLEYDQIEDFPPVEAIANDTSIRLKWIEEDPDHYLTYFVYYQGNDICSSDISTSPRLMSGGFLTTKHDEILISKLIPFTTYNITLSSVLHEKDKTLYVSTLETDEPTEEELPTNTIHISALDTAVNISWQNPKCTSRKGHLIHNLIVSNEVKNFRKTLQMLDGNSFIISGLRPYTEHNLTVSTARNARNLLKGIHTLNSTYTFKTLPGLAPPVSNLELYAVGSNKAYLRYDLPSTPQGQPVEIEVARCNVLSRAKCKSVISSLFKCTLWPNKFCVELDYLMPKQNYTFTVRIKNANTKAFGKDVQISTETVEKVPAPPENLSYQVVDCQASIDYCHLNISWRHPYFPNGTITAFNIILNSTHFNTSYSEEDQVIHEVYKIVNDTYLPKYTYQVKYIPYSHEYTLYLQSENHEFKSEFVSIEVKTDDLGDHIDQSPKLLGKGDKAIMFKLPPLDRRLDSYTLTIGVQDFNESVPLDVNSIKNPKLADHICHAFGVTWISQILKVKDNETKTVSITGLDETRQIKPNTKYCIIFVITNRYRGEEHDVVYYEKLTTPDSASDEVLPKSGSWNHLYMLLILLLLVPLAFTTYWCVKKRRMKKPKPTNENVYESLPFQEHEKDYANNRTYDQLIHK